MISASLYALQRQLGLAAPGGPVEPANPALQELLGQITPLLAAAIAKGTPAPPPSARVQAFLRSLQPIAQLAATYTVPLPARKKEFPPVTTVFRRNDIGKIIKAEMAYADGTLMVSIPRRDELGRILSVTHECRGQKFTTRVKRDALGRMSSTTISMDGQDAPPGVPQDDTSLINLLANVVQDNAPDDLLYEATFIPGRNPLTRAYVQRNHTGEPAFINIANRQIPIDQVRTPTNVSVQFDAEGRPFIRIRGWKMRVTLNREGLVQALEPENEPC